MDGDGYLEETGWVKGDTGILVIDDNGKVGSIHQLISEKFAGSDFTDGFEALLQFDINGDGIIHAEDFNLIVATHCYKFSIVTYSHSGTI